LCCALGLVALLFSPPRLSLVNVFPSLVFIFGAATGKVVALAFAGCLF
jgi:hypothetical protein